MKQALEQYRPTSGLGNVNDARSAFAATRQLLEQSQNGHRPGSSAFVFLLTKSTPVQMSELQLYVNTVIKAQGFVITVAVGHDLDLGAIQTLSSGRDFSFWTTELLNLAAVCKFARCPLLSID